VKKNPYPVTLIQHLLTPGIGGLDVDQTPSHY
jgi:hypothetical protein